MALKFLMITPNKMIFLALLCLALIGCQSTPENLGALSGRIILWHSWTPEETLVLDQALADFQEINPQVTVISLVLPPNELLERFSQSAQDGLGPDLMLGSKDWIGSLATAGLIRPLKDSEISDLNLNSRAIRLTGFHNNIYGIPLSVGPKALYYNKNLVDRPATTLDELLEHAAEGKQVAFVPRFEAAHWGIQAFGSGLFDADGILNLADSTFTDWLPWLKKAQDEL